MIGDSSTSASFNGVEDSWMPCLKVDFCDVLSCSIEVDIICVCCSLLSTAEENDMASLICASMADIVLTINGYNKSEQYYYYYYYYYNFFFFLTREDCNAL